MHVGQNIRKLRKPGGSRPAQIVAVDETHAIVHWQDNNTQTRVSKKRLETRRSEWDLEPDHYAQRWLTSPGR